MANHIYLQATEFISRPSGKQSFGYRLWDNESDDYCDSWSDLPADDLELLRRVVDDGFAFTMDLLDYMRSNRRGLHINDSWYSWEEIAAVVTPKET